MQDTNTPTKTLLVAVNPNPQSLTVSAAEKTRQALEQAKRPHTFVHLDECSFSPLLTAEEIHRRFSFDKETLRFQKELQDACLLGLFYPDWFGLPPALLVGWLQRVFAPGIVHTAIQDFDVLLPHALHTLYIAVLGIGISIVCAFVFALLLDISSFLHSLFFPVILFFQMVPVILFAPLFVIIFGYGTGTKLIIVVLMCFFPILVTLLQGFRYVSKDTISLLRSMGAKKFAIYRWGKIPSALVEMFSGLRLAVSYAVTASILSEWVGAVQGLGFVMIQSQKAFLIERVYVVIGAIFLMSIVLYLLVILIEFFFISKKQKGKILLKKEEEI